MAVPLHWLVNRGQSEVEALGGFGIFSFVVGLDRESVGRDENNIYTKVRLNKLID